MLNLEHRIKEIREVLKHIPTLQTGIDWIRDPSYAKEHVFKTAHKTRTPKTKKIMKPVVLYKATDKHPAQVEKVTEDIVVGHHETEAWTGMVTPATKARILKRIDDLERAVKAARQRANCQEVEKVDIGKKIMEFIIHD